MVDVRPPKSYEASHIEGSVNVPMYKALDPFNSGFGGAMKFLAYSFNGVTPIENNFTFIEELKAVRKLSMHHSHTCINSLILLGTSLFEGSEKCM